MIELGMPFSDPMADGPQIQFSSQIALENGMSLRHVLKAVKEIRGFSQIPLILMGYYNPVHAFGVREFADSAKRSGADGFIIPDLPPEEASNYRDQLRRFDLSAVFLVAPTSSPERIKVVDRASSDFVYAVTVAGVTGSGQKYNSLTDKYLNELSRTLTKPFVAGFGVSSPKSAKRLCRHADGVVIGSALIRVFRQAGTPSQGVRAVSQLLDSIRNVLR